MPSNPCSFHLTTENCERSETVNETGVDQTTRTGVTLDEVLKVFKHIFGSNSCHQMLPTPKIQMGSSEI